MFHPMGPMAPMGPMVPWSHGPMVPMVPWSPWSPGPMFPSPQIWAPYAKMVLGHDLQHMAPFGATTTGFCMVFQPATLIFSTLDSIFGGPGPGLGPRRPGPPLEIKNGGLENMFLWRDWSPTRFDRIFQEGNGFHGTQEPFGCANFPPKPSQGRVLQGFGPTPKIPGGPLALHGACLLPFVGPWPILPLRR